MDGNNLKVLANKSMEGNIINLIGSIIGFLSTLIFIYILTINFHWIGLIVTIFIFLLSVLFLFIYIVIKKSPQELIKYNEEYLIVYNKKIKWDEIESFKPINLLHNLFLFKYGHLNIILKNKKRIAVFRVEKIDETTKKLNELKNLVSWKR